MIDQVTLVKSRTYPFIGSLSVTIIVIVSRIVSCHLDDITYIIPYLSPFHHKHITSCVSMT